MSYKSVVEEASKVTGIDKKTINKVYKLYWKFIKDKMFEYTLNDITDIEEFRKLRVNFNIPGLGKFGVSEKRFLGVKEKQRISTEKYERKCKKD